MSHIFNSTGYEVFSTDMVRSKDCYLYDADDNRYVDFESGVWCTALGHHHARVNEALRRQMELIGHLGYRYTNAVVEEAAMQVLETAQLEDGKCVFLSSGSEAVEFGVQMARRVTGQPLLLSLAKSYLAAFGSAGRRTAEEWYFFDWSVCTGCPHLEECDPHCHHLKDIPMEQIGGFVFEPGNTSGLVLLPPKQLVRRLEQMVRERQGLIVVDEVTTGFGRTGAWYGYEHYGVQPDIIAMGKGMGNGYPVSAVVMRREVAERLEKSGFRYAQSHQNDAWGCAIVKEVITVLREDRFVERSHEVGWLFQNRLEQLKQSDDRIKEVRGRGLMIAMEFWGSDEQFPLGSLHRELFTEFRAKSPRLQSWDESPMF